MKRDETGKAPTSSTTPTKKGSGPIDFRLAT